VPSPWHPSCQFGRNLLDSHMLLANNSLLLSEVWFGYRSLAEELVKL
jgi:hypothetical protein